MIVLYKMSILQEKEFDKLSAIVDDTLGFLLDNYDFEKPSLPIIKNTYTLWRSLAYKKVKKMDCYYSHLPQTNYSFYMMSQCKYLKQFVNKIDSDDLQVDQNLKAALSLNNQSPSSAKQIQLMSQYSKILWRHTIYCELIEDILVIPYLRHLFPQNKNYRLKARFSELTPLKSHKDGGDMIEKVSEGVIKKGFGEIVQKIFTKTFLLRASSIAIKLNPLAIGATFAFSSLVDYYRKQKKQEQLVSKLQQMINNGKDNVEILRNVYDECMGLIGGVVKEDQKGVTAFLQKIFEVVEADWLQVVKCKDEDGWQIIVLQGQPEEQR